MTTAAYTLIADADARRVEACLEALRGLQTGVLVASGSQQALTLVHRFGVPQVLIIDLALPEDAYSVISALRAADVPPVEIVAWTPSRDLASLATARLSSLQVKTLRTGVAPDVLRSVLSRALVRARERRSGTAPRAAQPVEDAEHFIKRIADEARALSGAPGVAVYLRMPGESTFHALVTWTCEAPPPQTPYYLPQVFEWVVESGEPLLFPDLGAAPLPFQGPTGLHDAVRGLAAVPLVDKSRAAAPGIMGMVCLFDVKPLNLDEAALARLTALGQNLLRVSPSDAAARVGADRPDERSQPSIASGPLFLRDRAARWAAAREWARARRHRTPLSVVVFAIDADHERVTSVSWDDLVASVLARTARQADLAYVDPETRELVMILPDTTAPSARVVAERIRAAIQAATTFTASVAAGVAEWQGEESMDVLMTGAREKLRAAREAGHNRVA